MFENIEKARQLLSVGSYRAAMDEFIKLIQILKEKKNNEEAARLLIEILTKISDTNDKRNIYHAAENIVLEVKDLKIKDFEDHIAEFDKFVANAKSLYREKDEQFDKAGELAEIQADFYEANKKDNSTFILEAANDYSELATRILSKTRVRDEDIKRGTEYIKKAENLYKQAKKEEKILSIYNNLIAKQLENKNDISAENTIEQAINYLMQMKADETTILQATEELMNSYVLFIEYKITDILNPEMIIPKAEIISYDNNIATRLISQARDICIKRNAIPAILILAKELSLIGLAIFEKGQQRLAIPYFEKAKELFIEVGNVEEALNFGENLISIGLHLYTDEKYPIGRDYFNIAVNIGHEMDRTFEIKVYQKQAELFLKYNKFQLASESFRLMIEPLTRLEDSELKDDIPSTIRHLARDRFEKNDFHYAELFYRLTADFFLALKRIDLAAATYDSVWQSMFSVRQLQTGIDLAKKAADAYVKASMEEEGADVYINLAKQLLAENHYDIALERLILASEIIPEFLREQKFKILVELTTKYTEVCLKYGDIINARELWKAACDFNEILARSLIKRDVNIVVETIERHIANVRKFDNEELNQVTLESAQGSGKVLSEAKEHDRAAKVMISFATDFLRKNLTQYADPLFESGASEFIKANQPEEAARVLSALARYHSEHANLQKSFNYYLLATVKSDMTPNAKIFHDVARHCFETFTDVLNSGDVVNAEKGFEVAIQIEAAISKEATALLAIEIAKKFIDNLQYQLALKYYQMSITNFLETSSKNAIIVASEVIERGKKAFQSGKFVEANELICLGIETLYKGQQIQQGAQTARIEGERFLLSQHPEIGVNLLNIAIQYYLFLKDKDSAAEIHEIKGRYYISTNTLSEGLNEYKNAGIVYTDINKTDKLKKLINEITNQAFKIVTEKEHFPTELEITREKIATDYFTIAEEFSLIINDINLNSDIKHKAWSLFSTKLMHESAFKSLQKTYEVYNQMNNLTGIINLSSQVAAFSTKLIENQDLSNATKYLNLTIEFLLTIRKQKEAAGICISACEAFLNKENNEVAVSWGLRGAGILTEIKLVNEAINFLEELVEVLMSRNSIENAILCYGKIAKILEENGRIKEVEEIALKVMAFGTANMKSNNPAAGLRLWEVALTIGAIVGEEFTGRLCVIEGQTFYETKNYDQSFELFKEAHSLFKRKDKNNRLINLGNTIFDIAFELQKEKDLDTSFKYLPIAFESLIAGNELMLATDKMFSNAKNYIEVGRDKEGVHLITIAIDTLFSKGDIVGGIERCFVGAALLISYEKNTDGGRLIDKGMERISNITDEASIKHLATVCRNQGIILRDDDKLEASHIILASGIGILRTINDLIGIGQISIDLGKTLVRRNEMNAAVEAYRNGVHLLAQGNLRKEAADVVNDLITEGRKQIDNRNVHVGVPLVELSGDLFIFLGYPERIMVISEIFINLGGKMLNERNYDIAALYFSKAMELATKAGLKDYLPKVGNRCIDFGLKLVKEGDPILGIQFMNAGAELISEFEPKPEKAGRALTNYIEAVLQVLSPAYEKGIEDEERRLELIGQFIDSTIRFFTQIQAYQSMETLTKSLIEYGKNLLRTRTPRIARRIFEPALRTAEIANNTKQLIEIANTYLEHVNYLIENNKYEYLETTVNQALNIYLEVKDLKEIRKFMGIMAHSGRELCLKEESNSQGIKIINLLTDLAINMMQQELYPVVIIPAIHLNQQALEQENYELLIFARQIIIRLLKSIQSANLSLAILGNISLSNMIYEWFQPAEDLLLKSSSYDQAIKIIDQSLQLAVITQQVELGNVVIEKVLENIENIIKRKTSGIDLLYEIVAIGLSGLGLKDKIINIGNKCMNIGKEAAEKKKVIEAIDFLKAAGRIYAIVQDERLIAEVAITSATIGDYYIKEKNFKDGLYYYLCALENYELSHDEKSIQLIASTIENMFKSAPVKDGYLSFKIPGIVYANRDRIKEAETLAAKAVKQAEKMIKSEKKDLIFDSIEYLFAASEIYERTGNFIEETKLYDVYMFLYLAAISESKVVDLFIDMLSRTIMKKLRIWDFNAINGIFSKVKDQRILKSKKYIAIAKSIDSLIKGEIAIAQIQASEVNVKYERSLKEAIDSYRDQIKEDINETGKISVFDYMENQPTSKLVNIIIQDLYGRKEIEGKYFQVGLFVSEEQLTNTLNMCDTELIERGKASIKEIAEGTALTVDEALSVIRIEYLPQKFQALFNEDYTLIYSYQQLRNEVKELALGYQEIGNVDINKISQQLKFSPDIIQREIEYLILEGMINPRLVGRT
ncbi:MAG: hypothetical protein JXA54_09975 [Candidatus Heimdallarchaeota archaeon]|nr:hypothetical protein [Candidatus Heimdallarchaeota archaeon]